MLSKERLMELREKRNELQVNPDSNFSFFIEGFDELLMHALEIMSIMENVSSKMADLEEMCKKRTDQLHEVVHMMHKHLDNMHDATGSKLPAELAEAFRLFKEGLG